MVDLIVFVGSGGTGGHLIPKVARAVSHSNSKVKLIIVDDDIVEHKNCNRQNFFYTDVGKHKSEVLAKRYGAIFGIDISYSTDRFDYNILRKIITDIFFNTPCGKILIIDSVDNIKTRLHIHNIINNSMLVSPAGNRWLSWISIGNTDTRGQMVYYDRDMFDCPRTVVDLYPADYTNEAVLEEEARLANISCADNTVANPQTQAINDLGATIAFLFVSQMLFEETIKYDVILFDRFGNIMSFKNNESLDGKEKLSSALSSLEV